MAADFYYFVYHPSGIPTNKRVASLNELEILQNEEAIQQKAYAANIPTLSATALIELAQCSNLRCVELYMKDSGQQFIYAQKGEYAVKKQEIIQDTSGKEWTLPASTFYIEINPNAGWKAAHSLHSKTMADSLLNIFQQLGIRFADKCYYANVAGEGHRYVSEKYPGISLYVTSSFNPWYFRGLYANKITWPCYLFEVYRDK